MRGPRARQILLETGFVWLGVVALTGLASVQNASATGKRYAQSIERERLRLDLQAEQRNRLDRLNQSQELRRSQGAQSRELDRLRMENRLDRQMDRQMAPLRDQLRR